MWHFQPLQAPDSTGDVLTNGHRALRPLVNTMSSLCTAVVSARSLTAIVPKTSSASPLRHPAGSSSAAGNFIGFVAALDLYDPIHCATCNGTYPGRDGPGFSDPLKVGMNATTSQCPVIHKTKRNKHHQAIRDNRS
jgi:hypothetical protein